MDTVCELQQQQLNTIKQQTSTELIKFDENRKPQYQGYCKLQINLLSKVLNVIPVNENLKDVIGFAATFKWKFIRQKNILFVFGEFNLQDFALIFNDIKKCRKAFNAIFKNRTKDYAHKNILRNRFLKPIFEKVAENEFSRLKEIMEEWIQKHIGKEKREYLKLLNGYKNETNNDDQDIKFECDLKPVIKRKRRFYETKNNNVETESHIENESEANLTESQLKSALLKICTKLIDQSKFKIVNVKYQNRSILKLLIFTSSDKNECYEYYSKKEYFYHKCDYKNNNEMKAILAVDENGNECIKLENKRKKKHVCSPIQYDPSNYLEPKVIKKPDYEIIEKRIRKFKKLLIIFNPNDRSQCYEYYWISSENKFLCYGCRLKQKNRTAEIFNENTEAECIRLLNVQHFCEIRKYNPEKYFGSNQFVLSPDFEIQTKMKAEIERKTLIIFDRNDRNLCYTYYLHHKNAYFCNGCAAKHKTISAKIYQNSDGEEYVILLNAKHLCLPRTYIPQQNEIILRSPKIKFIKSLEKNKSKLFIFDSNDSKMCYAFSCVFGKEFEKYYCLGCKSVANNRNNPMNERVQVGIVIAYLYKDDDDTNDEGYYVKMMDGQKHICQPRIYEPEIYETKILKPKDDYILFRNSKNDAIRLVIYHPKNKNLCYKFHYCDKINKNFRCSGCDGKKVVISVKIQQDSNRNEYLIANQKKHICKPVKISSIIKSDTVMLEKSGLFSDELRKPTTRKEIDESRIIRSPNFELRRNIKGDKDRVLIIFNNDNNRKLCYSFGYQTTSNSFYCYGKNSFKCRSTAKLHIDLEKNNEKYVILGLKEHTCEPIKYEEERNIIKSSDFMIFNRDDKTKIMKCVIFTTATKEFCYEYSYIQKTKSFRCSACFASQVIVCVKLSKDDETGEEYIQLLKNDHICAPKKFVLEEFQPKTIPESGFKLCSNKNGKENSKLILFDSEKNGFCYEYYLDKNLFRCNKCSYENKNVTAKLCQKENGEKFLELSAVEHICQSTKYKKV